MAYTKTITNVLKNADNILKILSQVREKLISSRSDHIFSVKNATEPDDSGIIEEKENHHSVFTWFT